ncbi:MAG: hypothetical protein QGI09_03375, partial [Dehalococcoidia bacterium]|nr:hypothetical protein [Dehalococcoidia bacterium]
MSLLGGERPETASGGRSVVEVSGPSEGAGRRFWGVLEDRFSGTGRFGQQDRHSEESETGKRCRT